MPNIIVSHTNNQLYFFFDQLSFFPPALYFFHRCCLSFSRLCATFFGWDSARYNIPSLKPKVKNSPLHPPFIIFILSRLCTPAGARRYSGDTSKGIHTYIICRTHRQNDTITSSVAGSDRSGWWWGGVGHKKSDRSVDITTPQDY